MYSFCAVLGFIKTVSYVLYFYDSHQLYPPLPSFLFSPCHKSSSLPQAPFCFFNVSKKSRIHECEILCNSCFSKLILLNMNSSYICFPVYGIISFFFIFFMFALNSIMCGNIMHAYTYMIYISCILLYI